MGLRTKLISSSLALREGQGKESFAPPFPNDGDGLISTSCHCSPLRPPLSPRTNGFPSASTTGDVLSVWLAGWRRWGSRASEGPTTATSKHHQFSPWLHTHPLTHPPDLRPSQPHRTYAQKGHSNHSTDNSMALKRINKELQDLGASGREGGRERTRSWKGREEMATLEVYFVWNDTSYRPTGLYDFKQLYISVARNPGSRCVHSPLFFPPFPSSPSSSVFLSPSFSL